MASRILSTRYARARTRGGWGRKGCQGLVWQWSVEGNACVARYKHARRPLRTQGNLAIIANSGLVDPTGAFRVLFGRLPGSVSVLGSGSRDLFAILPSFPLQGIQLGLRQLHIRLPQLLSTADPLQGFLHQQILLISKGKLQLSSFAAASLLGLLSGIIRL